MSQFSSEDYFFNTTMSDVTLVVDNQQFPAHKFILGASSEVFERMLFGDTKESHQKLVVIEDVSAVTFSLILKYLYLQNTAELEEFTDAEQAMDVLRVAHQYQINGVVNTMVASLMNLVTAVNLITVYRFSMMYELKALTESCEKFVDISVHELLNDECFLRLPIKELKQLLSRVKFPIYSKSVISKAFKAFRQQNPNKDLECLINLIPLETYTIDELIDDIRALGVLNMDHLFMIIMFMFIIKLTNESITQKDEQNILDDSNTMLEQELKTLKNNYEELESKFGKYKAKNAPKQRTKISFR